MKLSDQGFRLGLQQMSQNLKLFRFTDVLVVKRKKFGGHQQTVAELHDTFQEPVLCSNLMLNYFNKLNLHKIQDEFKRT
jgi:hypothetical protein